jgi:hypothetical protein
MDVPQIGLIGPALRRTGDKELVCTLCIGIHQLLQELTAGVLEGDDGVVRHAGASVRVLAIALA